MNVRSSRRISIAQKAEDNFVGSVSAWLYVVYTPDYPETLPQLRLEPIEGELTGEETDELLHGMAAAGTESLGMAMVFTMVSYLREHLVTILEERNNRIRQEEERRYAEMEAKEAEKKKGTPVTRESFTALMQRLKQKALEAKKKAEEDRVKALPPKEREEYKKINSRSTGESPCSAFLTTAEISLPQVDNCSRPEKYQQWPKNHTRRKVRRKSTSASTRERNVNVQDRKRTKRSVGTMVSRFTTVISRLYALGQGIVYAATSLQVASRLSSI